MSQRAIVIILCVLSIFMPALCLAATRSEAVAAIWIHQSGNATAHTTAVTENQPLSGMLNGTAQRPVGNFLAGDFEGRNISSIAFVYVDSLGNYRARISPSRPNSQPIDWPSPLTISLNTQPAAIVAGDYDADGASDLAALFVSGSKLKAKILFGPNGNRTVISSADFGSSMNHQILSTNNTLQRKDEILVITNDTGNTRKLSRFNPIEGTQQGATSTIGSQDVSSYKIVDSNGDGRNDILALRYAFGVNPAAISAITYTFPNYSAGPTFTLPGSWAKLLAANMLPESGATKDELVAIELRGTPQASNVRASIFSLPNSSAALANPTLLPIVGSALSTTIAGDFIAPTYKISGKVTLPGGAPLAGAAVSIGIAQTSTDTNGNFEFYGLGNGIYSVVPSLSGYDFTPALNQIQIADGDRSGVNFTGISTPQSGARYSVNGRIIPGVSGVTVSLQDEAGSVSRQAVSITDGTYAIGDVPRGSYTLRAHKNGIILTPSAREITVTTQSVTGQDFTILDDPTAPRFKISGRIKAISGDPLQNIQIRLEPRGIVTTTSSLGEFTFNYLPEGNYLIVPDSADFIFEPATRPIFLSNEDVNVGEFIASCSQNRFPIDGVCRTIQPITPRLECVNLNNQGSFQAHFGYMNPNDFDIRLRAGELNGFSPAPTDRRQPTTFVQGAVWNNFVVNFDGEPLSWRLFDQTVTASRNSTLCSPNTPPVANAGGPYQGICSGGTTTVELNGTGTRDADGHKLALQWETNCASGVIENGNSERAKLIFPSTPQNSSCQVSLTATDQLATVQATANVDLSACVDTNGLGPVDSCGVHNGSNSCIDCYGVPNGGANIDRCGQCGGKGLSCFGCVNFDIRRQLHALDMRSIQYRDNLVRIAKKLSASLGRAKDKKSKKKKKALLQIIKTARALDSGNRKEIFSHPSTVNICPASDNCSLIDYRRLSDTIALSNKTSQRITAKLIKDKSIGGVQRKKEKRKLSQLTKAGQIALQEVPRFASTCQ